MNAHAPPRAPCACSLADLSPYLSFPESGLLVSHRNAVTMTPPDDDDVLQALGIKPELSRKMGTFGNYAISFSVICILAGGMSLFGFGLGHGGPVVMLG